ncbi:MAG TPA: chemotaxis protein CheW [Acidobacteriaceae bacterium]|jgi:purine-binding chemotaxis protein CheW|nr:chemotaxis protein CheW [Acidobacteriaceae bacterium]
MTMLRNVSEGVTHDDVCSIHVGNERFAVRLTDVFEVTASVELRACPLSPPHIAGLMQYRGEVLTTVCLRTLLGMQRGPGPASSVVMIGSRGLFALLVDEIGEVLPVAISSYEPVPATVETRCQELLSGTYKLEHGLLPVLDAKRLEPSALRSQHAPAHSREANIKQ